MGLGNEMKVNLGEYFKVLGLAGFEQRGAGLQKVLREKYEVGGEVSFYQGDAKDGGVLLVIKSGEQIGSGDPIGSVLRFREDGQVIDALSGKAVYKTDTDFGSHFIAGIFGAEELTKPFDKANTLLSGGIAAARGCYDTDQSTACSTRGIDDALYGIKRMKEEETLAIKEAEAKKVAVIEADIEAELDLIEEILKWTTAKDEDPEDISEIMNKYKGVLELRSDPIKKRLLLAQILREISETDGGGKYLWKHKLLESEQVAGEDSCDSYDRYEKAIKVPNFSNKAGITWTSEFYEKCENKELDEKFNRLQYRDWGHSVERAKGKKK